MKKTFLILSAVLTLTFVACNNSGKNENASADSLQALDTAKLSKGATYYQCEMHPEVTSDKPGKCPKCGMELMKMEKK